MSISAALLADSAVTRLFEVLDGAGEETRIAGGAVRDALIGKQAAEIDFATTATPDEVIRRASAAGLKTVPTGVEHGTVTVIVDKRPFEVTTLRRDVETFGRHAVVAFGRDWAEDAQRRDFTINGLFLDRMGNVHDFVGGEADLAARRVRFIGDARARIREDYLRILRFFRFFSGYADGAPDAEAFSAAVAERAGLDRLSRERVRTELFKLVVTRRAAETAKIMSDAGLLGLVLGGMARPRRLLQLIALAPDADAVMRVGALTMFIPENADRLRERLRLSNEETERLRRMATGPVLTPKSGEAERKAALYRLGAQTFRDRVLFCSAGESEDAGDILALPDQWAVPKFPVTAAQIMAQGVEKGPRLGAALARIEENWIAAGFPMDAAAVERLIAEGAEEK